MPLDTLQSTGTADTSTATGRAVAARGPWFHNLHLPDGTQTAPDHPLGDFPRFKWTQIAPHVPEDLSGWRVLDIGCNAGFYTFELAKRGADVLGIDVDEHYLGQARWAADQFGLTDRTEFRQMQVYDLRTLDERFDLVWFMGVLYHLRYPLLALDLVAEKVDRLMMFQTLTMPGDDVELPPADLSIGEREAMQQPGWPKMAFIEHRLAGDPTNWWAPNHACVEAMLRSAGLEPERIAHETYRCLRDSSSGPPGGNELRAGTNGDALL
jgi:tRNA (mo5U34)-methyltransferase